MNNFTLTRNFSKRLGLGTVMAILLILSVPSLARAEVTVTQTGTVGVIPTAVSFAGYGSLPQMLSVFTDGNPGFGFYGQWSQPNAHGGPALTDPFGMSINANGHYDAYLCTADTYPGWCYATSTSLLYTVSYDIVGGVLSGDEVETAGTRFLSYAVSTSTRTFSVQFYTKPEDLAEGVDITLLVSTPIYSVWFQDSAVATTSGVSGYIFEYTGSFASTTIEQFTFLSQLLSTDFTEDCDPFNNAQCSRYVFDEISTTTYPGQAMPLTPADIENGIAANCTPFSSFWSVGLCIQYLLYPQPEQVERNIEDLKNDFLSRVPLGYVTRVVSILSATTTQSMPVLSYTFASTSPFGAIGAITFDPWSAFSTSTGWTTWVSDREVPKTLWEIMEVPITTVVYLTLLFMIIHDITGIHKHHKKE